MMHDIQEFGRLVLVAVGNLLNVIILVAGQ